MWDVNELENTVYIRLRHRILVQPLQKVFLQDIAQIIAEENLKDQLNKVLMYKISNDDRNIVVIHAFDVVREMTKLNPKVDIEILGPTQTIVEVVFKKKKYSFPLFLITWFLLFFGAVLRL